VKKNVQNFVPNLANKFVVENVKKEIKNVVLVAYFYLIVNLILWRMYNMNKPCGEKECYMICPLIHKVICCKDCDYIEQCLDEDLACQISMKKDGE
jgi:hypothetical protein